MFTKPDDNTTGAIMNDCNNDITKCKSIHEMITTLNKYNKYKITQLKDWIKQKNLWDELLYNELMTKNIYTIDQLSILSQKEIDSILRKVRINKLDLLKNESLKNKFDALLINFKKECKNLKKNETNKTESGINIYVNKTDLHFIYLLYLLYLYISVRIIKFRKKRKR